MQNITTQDTTVPAFDASYANTTTKPIFISVSFWAQYNNQVFNVFCDTNSNPTTKVFRVQIYSGESAGSFIVLPNYVYKITRENPTTGGLIVSFVAYS